MCVCVCVCVCNVGKFDSEDISRIYFRNGGNTLYVHKVYILCSRFTISPVLFVNKEISKFEF
jgi:hypothetical protein